MNGRPKRWYHHLLHARVLLTIALTLLVYLMFAGFGIYLLIHK